MFLFLPVRKEKGAWAGQGVNDELRGECDFVQDKLEEKNNKKQQSLEKCKKSLKKTWSQRSQERAGVRRGEEKASGPGRGQVP